MWTGWRGWTTSGLCFERKATTRQGFRQRHAFHVTTKEPLRKSKWMTSTFSLTSPLIDISHKDRFHRLSNLNHTFKHRPLKMPPLSSVSDPRAYHILTYGTLLGSNLQNTFLAGPIAYKCLPRPQFSTLQQNIFPPFFSFQTALPLILALTWPGEMVAGASGAGSVRKDA